MFAFRPGNFKIFLFVVFIIAVGLYWKIGFDKAKVAEKTTSFFSYVKEDSSAKYGWTAKFIKSIPDKIVEAIQDDNKIRRGSLIKIADGLELFKAENEKYPASLSELSADYMNSQTKILEKKGLEYSTSEDGQSFKLSIPLKNGEIYTIER